MAIMDAISSISIRKRRCFGVSSRCKSLAAVGRRLQRAELSFNQSWRKAAGTGNSLAATIF